MLARKVHFEAIYGFVQMSHDTFSRNTRVQLRKVMDALKELMTPPEPHKRPIGFVHPKLDKPSKDGQNGKDSAASKAAKAKTKAKVVRKK
jgi:hypothetical protein